MTNYSRHLEEIAKEAERQTLASVQSLLMDEKVNKAAQLLEYWEEYLAISANANTQTMEEEVQLFLQRVHKLEALLKELYMKCNSTDDGTVILRLLGKCSKISDSVNRDKSLSAGGRFEWVDSVLVKCLQEGSWLLVDNVNLCSPAVLDRLNALLEPNGILTISERGVDENGKMFEVKPHKDFRIFLTMDPKNGEISRAMRNRGVEIYMLNESEAISSNQFDLESLMDSEGLNNTEHINALLKIHDFISSLILIEKPGNMEVIQCSSLISRQLRHGIAVSDAFYNTCIEVYYKTRNPSVFNCNNVLEVIRDGIERCLVTNSLSFSFYSSNVTINTINLPRWSSLDKIKYQSAIFETGLKKFGNDFPEVSKKARATAKSLGKVDNSRNSKDLTIWSDLECVRLQNELFETINFYTVANLLVISYSLSSMDDIEYRSAYLRKIVSRPEWQAILERFDKTIKYFEFKTPTFPYDSRWLDNINNDNNINTVILHYALQVEVHKLKDMIEVKLAMKDSLYQYLLALKRKEISDLLTSSICASYISMRQEHFIFMRHLNRSFSVVSNVEKTLMKVLELLSWRQALHSFLTSVSIPEAAQKSPKSFESKLDTLALYYRWFYKYSVVSVTKLLDAEVPASLQTILSNINKDIEEQFSFIHKLSSRYKKLNNVPEFLTSEGQLAALDFLQSYDLYDPKNETKEIFAFLKHSADYRTSLVKVKSLLCGKDNHLENELRLIKSFEVNKGQGQHLKLEELEILPLMDVLTQMLILRVIKSIDANENFSLASLNSNCLVPIGLEGVLIKYKETNEKKLLHEIKSGFYTVATNSPSVRSDEFIGGKDNSEISPTIAGIEPMFVDVVTRLLVHLDGDCTTLSNVKDVEEQRRFLGLILWSNMHAMADEKFDFMTIQFEILKENVKSFMNRLQQALNIPSEDLEGFPYDQIKDLTLKTIIKCIKSKYLDLKHNFNNTKHNDASFSCIADLHMNIGFAEAYINSQLPQVDPLAKKAMKKNHLASVLGMFEQMKSSFELQNRLFSNEDECAHPYYRCIQDMICQLQGRLEKYGDSANAGVKAYSYSYVAQQIKHATVSILKSTLLDDIAHCSDLVSNLQHNFTHWDKIKSYIEHFESSIPSFKKIIQDWKQYRGSYPDIVEPLLENISQFLYGFKLKIVWIKRETIKWEYRVKFNLDLESEVVKLVALPSFNKDFDVDYYNLYKNEHFVDHILCAEQAEHIKKIETVRILKCAIQDCFNQCIVTARNSREIDRNLLNKFNGLVNTFIILWNKQEENKEKEKSEAESIYKIRSKCDDKPEEEQIAEELKELFPNHHVLDFSDLRPKSMTESVPEPAQSTTSTVDAITEEDFAFIVDLHSKLYKNFIKTEWFVPEMSKNIQADFVSPLMEKYKVVRRIMDNHPRYFCYTVDAKLSGSLGVLVEVSKRHDTVNELVGETSSPRITNRKTKDFYKDSDVEEIKSCCHVLETLRTKVGELLAEWPDQPTLTTILIVIDRISKFNIKSPISRYLTGFDILLAKCYEWEQVAHSGVSLINSIPALTAQIITWRKLELSRWKDLLNSTFNQMTKPLTKWWLYMYNLSNEYITEKQITESELVDTLQRFITKSSLVEFTGRLEIIFEFHCYAAMLPKSPESNAFISILWNIYNYFNQFSASVNGKIKDMRTPIERKLKEYVKIAKWKDVNYWSVKDRVDKSHKTLHACVREYKEVLSQPVAPYLTNPPTDIPIEVGGIWDRPQRQNPKSYHYTLDADSYIVKASAKDTPYLSKAQKICRETILCTSYPDLVKSLEAFVTDVIETSSHLRKLEIDTTLPKEKQKSQAKTILHQKHRALADLFQNLSKMGMSFKTGILNIKLKKPTEEFTIKPVNLTASYSYLSHNKTDEKLLTIWDSCELYYYRCLMRYDVLTTMLVTPAKDLGMQNIERCRGYSSHLLTLCQHQKKSLVEATRQHYILRGYLKQMREACEHATFMTAKTIDNIKHMLNSLAVVMSQVQLILNCCPEEPGVDNRLMEIPLLEPNSTKLKHKEDEKWHKATKCINSIIHLKTKILNNIQKSEALSPHTETDVFEPKYIPVANKNLIFEELEKVVENLNNLKQIFEPTSVVDSLDWLISAIHDAMEENIDDLTSSSVFKYESLVGDFTKSLLVVFQNLYKKYRDANVNKSVDPEHEEEEGKGMQENHLKELITKNLHSDISSLELEKISTKAEEVLKVLIGGETYLSEESRNAVSQFLPLFEQVLQFSQYFITQQVAAYRSSCKLTSILLNIFIDLASKGFCIPPELSEEMDKEGMSKPSDGMGLGEGQGERDVSDKIESEDQLDDAQPADQEKQQSEDPDCKEEENAIEMSEDFDSKLQDKKANEDEDEEQNDNSDAEEQMGETEKGSNQLDQEIWGDEKEDNEAGEDTQDKEEEGTGGEKDGEDHLGAKEDEEKSNKKEKKKNTDASDEQDDEAEKNEKEITEMDEPEYDDEQTDPYHGNQPELPEPEAMDLPDDLQLDEGEEKDGEQQEENPFDIDTMKDQQIPEDKSEETPNQNEDSQQKDEEKDFSSDDEDVTKKDDEDKGEGEEDTEEKPSEKDSIEEAAKSQGGDDEEETVEPEDTERSGLDENPSNEEYIQAMEVDQSEASDKTQATQSENLKSDQPIEETCEEDKPDKEGMGQSQMEENDSGHSIQSNMPQEAHTSTSDKKEKQKKEKPGTSDLKRSLGDVNQPVEKKLKTMDAEDNDGSENPKSEEQQADMYQHIKEAKEEKSTQVLDAATQEQVEEQKKDVVHKDNEAQDENIDVECSENLPKDDNDPMDIDNDTPTEKPMKSDSKKENPKNRKHPEGDRLDEVHEVEIDGELVKTSTVPHGGESFHHTQFHLFHDAAAVKLTEEEISKIRGQVESELSTWKSVPASIEAEQTWQKISSITSTLAQDLSEKLRLILEPTQASHLKGDFRTGRRINMRKVIPYIASQFRKDKIWLRRTKPSKREYQIVLAIDDSSSMSDSHSKELAFESVALISKALSLLESGHLAVVSFGEETKVHHKLTDPFTDKSGVEFLQKFQFDQQKTHVGNMMNFVTEMFERSNIQSSLPNAKLLLIVGDGRGIFSEGEKYVTQAIRRAKLANVFVVFVIIDSPENKNSIFEMKSTVFKDGKFLGLTNYMDQFPFSFYLILRDINSLPAVLSDALMQWFEMVTAEQ